MAAQFGFVTGAEAREEALATAMEMLERAREIDPSSAIVFANLAFSHMARGEIDLAISAARTAVELNPNDDESWATLAWSLNVVGQYEEAIRDYRTALRLSPQMSDWHLISLGISYMLAGQVDEALAAYQAELDKPPNSAGMEAGARIMMALALDTAGREQDARDQIILAMEVYSGWTIQSLIPTLPFEDPTIMDTLVETWRRLGLPE